MKSGLHKGGWVCIQLQRGSITLLMLLVVATLHLAVIMFLLQQMTPPVTTSLTPPRTMTAMLVAPTLPLQPAQPRPEPASQRPVVPVPIEPPPQVIEPKIQSSEATTKPLPAVEKIPSEQAVMPPPTMQPAEVVPALVVTEPAPPLIAPVSNAAHLSNPAPIYPRQSQRRKEQGTVMLEVLILADGSVAELRIKESSGYQRLDQAALNAVAQWRYVPANQGGETIDYWHLQPVAFALR